MKLLKLTFIAIFLFSKFNLFSQEDSTKLPLTFTKVLKFDSIFSKEQIFNSAQIWISKNFNSSLFVVEVKDKEAGILSCNGNVDYAPKGIANYTYNGIIEFSFSIFVKNGKLKYEFTNFKHKAINPTPRGVENSFGLILNTEKYEGEKTNWGTTKALDQKNWTQIRTDILALIERIEKSLILEVSKQEKSNNDW
jgi:hypothetical protein